MQQPAEHADFSHRPPPFGGQEASKMEWLLSPLVPFALFALLTFVLLWTYVCVQREISRLHQAQKDMEERWKAKVDAHRGLLAALAAELQELRDQPRPAAPATVSMNLTRRHQVLRMARAGESVAQIASTLQAPRREVELLLRMQKGPRAPGAAALGPSEFPAATASSA
jgi:hypothetical protein